MTANKAVIPQLGLADLAATIRTAHQGVMVAAANMIEHALAAGDALLAAKVKAGHGNWLKYLRNECDLSEDRAERYMRVARARAYVKANSASLRNLGLTAVIQRLPSPEPPTQSLPARPPTQSSSKPTRHDAAGYLTAVKIEEGQKLFDALGSRAVAQLIPPTWGMALVCTESGASTGEVARLLKKIASQNQQIANLKRQLQEKQRLIDKLNRKLRECGPVFGEGESVDGHSEAAPTNPI